MQVLHKILLFEMLSLVQYLHLSYVHLHLLISLSSSSIKVTPLSQFVTQFPKYKYFVLSWHLIQFVLISSGTLSHLEQSLWHL